MQIVLGAEAKDDDVNVVEVEAMGYKADVKFPIAVMRGGSGQSQAVLDLLFPDPPVTFHLAKGSGPVHLLGNHTIGSEFSPNYSSSSFCNEFININYLNFVELGQRLNFIDKPRPIKQFWVPFGVPKKLLFEGLRSPNDHR